MSQQLLAVLHREIAEDRKDWNTFRLCLWIVCLGLVIGLAGCTVTPAGYEPVHPYVERPQSGPSVVVEQPRERTPPVVVQQPQPPAVIYHDPYPGY